MSRQWFDNEFSSLDALAVALSNISSSWLINQESEEYFDEQNISDYVDEEPIIEEINLYFSIFNKSIPIEFKYSCDT